MRVRELLRRKRSTVVTVETGADVGTAVRLLMRHNIGGLPVVTGAGEVVGFVAERDIVRAVDQNPGEVHHLTVERVMYRPAPTCEGEAALHQVMERMTRDRLRHLVVVDDGRLRGVVSVGDLVKHRLDELEMEAGVLRDYVTAQRALR